MSNTTSTAREKDPIVVDFPNAIARAFPAEFECAWKATEDVVATLPGRDFAPLERRSPGLKGYDWSAYLHCSVARMVRFLRALRNNVRPGSRVLDVGSYFGNFSLMCQRAGYAVTALDSYGEYGNALEAVRRILDGAGVTVLDFADVGFDLSKLSHPTYDAVICAGVIEHMAHTPRPLLEAIDRRLAVGGLLLLDTPNLAYLYNRQKLARGESVFPAIQVQYFTEIPFEGHHREYTLTEVEWLLTALGHRVLSLETFNYSFYGAGVLSGQDAENFRAMEGDATAREVIFAASQKTNGL